MGSGSGHEKIKMLLLEKGGLIDIRDDWVFKMLQHVIYAGYAETVKVVLNHAVGLPSSWKAMELLNAAVARSDPAMVRLLLKRGIKPSHEEGYLRRSILEIASAKGHGGIIDMLRSYL